MGRRREEAIPALEKLRARFWQWRRGRTGRAPIPDPLWEAAVELARRHSLFRVARELRLNYASLKQRVEGASGQRRAARSKRSGPVFVELPATVPASPPECVIELEDRGRAKMTIRLSGRSDVDLAGLAVAFWKRRR